MTVLSEILVRSNDLDYTEDVIRLYGCTVAYVIDNAWHDNTVYVQIEGESDDIDSLCKHLRCA